MKITRNVIRVIVVLTVFVGILGFGKRTDIGLLLLGILQIIEAIDYCRKKKKQYAVVSFFVGVCLIISVIAMNFIKGG